MRPRALAPGNTSLGTESEEACPFEQQRQGTGETMGDPPRARQSTHRSVFVTSDGQTVFDSAAYGLRLRSLQPVCEICGKQIRQLH